MSTQDGVLRKVYDLYRHPTTMQNCGDKGIVEMAKEVGIVKLCPRNKATVMILGNHSSGKFRLNQVNVLGVLIREC